MAELTNDNLMLALLAAVAELQQFREDQIVIDAGQIAREPRLATELPGADRAKQMQHRVGRQRTNSVETTGFSVSYGCSR